MSLKGKTPEEQAEFYLKRWNDAHIQLETGERAVQMLKHKPYHFITDYGRVYSVYTEQCRLLKQYQKGGRNPKTSTGKQLAITTTGGSVRVSKLVQEYFDNISEFNPNGLDNNDLDCHHIESYDTAKGTDNNRADNLQTVDKNIHRDIITPLQGATLGEDGLQLHDPNAYMRKLAEATDKSYAVFSKIDDSSMVYATWGLETSAEDIVKMLQTHTRKKYDDVLEYMESICVPAKGEDENEHVCTNK